MLTLTPIAAFAVAFALALVLTPLVRRMALRVGAIDPINRRKIHAHEVPRLGGVAIAAAFYLPVLVLFLRTNLFSQELYGDPHRAATLLFGGLAILALGVYDDLAGASAAEKLAVQIPVAVLTWWVGLRIGDASAPSGTTLSLPPLVSLATTVLWIVGVVNALNLIDGLDGLASGIALEALAATALCAWHREEAVLALLAITLGGAVAGFLVHNFHPASVFMGDSGSMFLGYVLAVGSIWSGQKGATAVGVVLPALALGLPLLDTSLAVWRRVVHHRPVFSADLDHIHHRLLAIGWSHGATVMLLYGVGFFYSSLSVLLVLSNEPRLVWPVMVGAMVVAFSLIRWLGYLGPKRGLVDTETQRKNILCRRALHRLERQLAVATTEAEIAEAVADFEAAANSLLDADSPLRAEAAHRAAHARARRAG